VQQDLSRLFEPKDKRILPLVLDKRYSKGYVQIIGAALTGAMSA
jgi:hypothetical protein